MRTNSISIRIELSRKILRTLACASALLVAGAAAVASADVEHQWTDGDVLSADDLNANFRGLDERVAALESAPTYLEALSDESIGGEFYADLLSQDLFLEIPAGRWLVSASATVSTTASADMVQLALWDDSQTAEVPSSRGPLAVTQALFDPYSCGAQGAACSGVPITTTAVLELAEPTTIRLRALRNGASVVWLGLPDQSLLTLQVQHRLTAQRL
jgi:hypothetical protein